MDRRNSSSSTDPDPASGYAQVVRLGSHIYVSGTTGINGRGQVVAPGDVYAQATQAFQNIELALRQVGAERKHVIRTRMFVSAMKDSEAVARAHAEFFGKLHPTTTVVQADSLAADTLVEIEVEAVLS